MAVKGLKRLYIFILSITFCHDKAMSNSGFDICSSCSPSIGDMWITFQIKTSSKLYFIYFLGIGHNMDRIAFATGISSVCLVVNTP